MKSGCSRLLPLVVLAFALLLLPSCESKGGVAGTYQAEGEPSLKQREVFLELKENGEGAWRKADEEVPFTWYMKDGQLRLNTKGGGVVVGKMEKDTIQTSLPGGKTMVFKRVR